MKANTHLPMEQAVGGPYLDTDEKLTLWSQPIPALRTCALTQVLGIPRVTLASFPHRMAAALAASSDPFITRCVVCKLSMLTGPPCQVPLTREKVFYCHRGRHPFRLHIKTA